jgi:co-chaperonin GroES (HSP10)
VSEQRFSIKPSAGRIWILEDGFRYEGRIVIPEKVQKRPTTGTIKWIGSGVENYSEGDRVVYGLYSGTVVNFKNMPTYRVLSPDEILGTLVGDAELEGVGT